jgi:hypothetical protein
MPGVDKWPGQVNGALVRGAEELRRLRRDWGDALVVVRGGDFSGADLRGAGLRNICFVETKFVRSDLSGADGAGIGFLRADLSGAKLVGATLVHVVIDNPYMKGVDAAGADLSDGRMSGSSFGTWEGLRLDRARLRGFRFDCLPIQGESCVDRTGPISFRGADLRGAWIDGYWGDGDWHGARFDDTRVSLRQLLALGSIGKTGSLLVYENPARVRLSAAEYEWLRRHIGRRGDLLPVDSDRRPVTRPPAWLRPGVEALFAAPVIDFDAEARRSRLFRRLLPAIVAGAISYVRVKVDARGRIDASGSALGGNGHMCGLGARHLRLGRSGWYSGVAEPPDGAYKPPHIPVPVLRFRGDRAEVYERGHPSDEASLRNGFDFLASCGARAGFEEMIRVPYPPGGAHRLWHEAGLDAGDDGDER